MPTKMDAIEAPASLLRDILNVSPAVLYVCEIEPPYRTLFVTEGISDQLGYSPYEVVGVPNFWLERIHPDDLTIAHDALSALRETGQAHIECRMCRKDGDYRWIADDSKVLINDSGIADRVVGSCLDITERKRAEQDVEESNLRLRAIIERLPVGMIVATHEGRTAELMNDAFSEITGYDLAEAGTFEDAIQRLIPASKQRVAAVRDMQLMVDEATRSGRPSSVRQERFVHRDGSRRDVEVQFVDLKGLGVWTFRDITKRVQAEERVQRVSMIKDALSAINRTIVRVESDDELFRETCDVAVHLAGNAGAWIGVVDNRTGTLTPVAASGAATIDVAALKAAVSVDLGGTPQDPSIAALKAGRPVVRSNALDDANPSESHWHILVSKFGFASAAAFPLWENRRLRAVLTVYHGQPNAYDDEAVLLFEEVAADISFALAALRTRRDHEMATHSLQESEARFRAIVEQTISGIYIIDKRQRLSYVNPRLAEIFGYDANTELVGRSALDLVAPKDRALVAKKLEARLSGTVDSVRYDFLGVRKNGSTLTVGAHGTKGTYRGESVVIGALQDVSEVRRAEQELQKYVERLEHTTESTIDIIAMIGELRDPYTQGHERRVSELAAAIGAEMGLDDAKIEGLRVIGHLHDVGKIGVPAEILTKPAKLSAAEYELVKEHAEKGYQILKGYEFPWPVAEAVRQHHERLDGSGYPQGLKGDEIMLEARILAVADTVEAMSSHRPYRAAIGLKAALAEVEKGRGSLYDPNVVDACLRLFRDKGYRIAA